MPSYFIVFVCYFGQWDLPHLLLVSLVTKHYQKHSAQILYIKSFLGNEVENTFFYLDLFCCGKYVKQLQDLTTIYIYIKWKISKMQESDHFILEELIKLTYSFLIYILWRYVMFWVCDVIYIFILDIKLVLHKQVRQSSHCLLFL